MANGKHLRVSLSEDWQFNNFWIINIQLCNCLLGDKAGTGTGWEKSYIQTQSIILCWWIIYVAVIIQKGSSAALDSWTKKWLQACRTKPLSLDSCWVFTANPTDFPAAPSFFPPFFQCVRCLGSLAFFSITAAYNPQHSGPSSMWTSGRTHIHMSQQH